MDFSNKRAEGIYKNLEKQIRSVSKHNRQGSFETKNRYFEANQRFCKHLAERWGTQKFSNIQDKHLDTYIKEMQGRGLAPSTIKTDLSAIRMYHDKIGGKNELSGNDKFELERRKFGGVDRAWTQQEYSKFKEICSERGYDRARDTCTLARECGLRIHETTRIDRNDAENALRRGYLHVKGKGGKERDVELTEEARNVIQRNIGDVERGCKLFVSEDERTDLVIKQIQNTINKTRDEWEENRGEYSSSRTFHGLRHAYAREHYEDFIDKGMSEYEARKCVSQMLGHERDEVTRIYLARGI